MCGADSSKELIVDENGDYVKFGDYEQLKAENERLLSAIKTHKGDRPRFNMADFNLYKEAGLMEHLEEQGE
jgi:hypothetical protein